MPESETEKSTSGRDEKSKSIPIWAIVTLIIGIILLAISVSFTINANQNSLPIPIAVPIVSFVLVTWSLATIFFHKKKKNISTKRDRPLPFTIIVSILIFMHGRMFFLSFFSANIFEPFSHVFIVTTTGIMLVSAIGLFKLKKWAIYSYFSAYIFHSVLIRMVTPGNLHKSTATEFFIGQFMVMAIIAIIIFIYKRLFYYNSRHVASVNSESA